MLTRSWVGFFLNYMYFSNRVTTITQDKILPKVVDNLLSDNFSTFRFMSNGLKWSGETLKKPVKLFKNTHGGSFSGMDKHSTATADTRRMMQYDLRGYEIPVAIPGLERVVNQTDAQVISLVRVELESSQEDALDDIGTMFYADGTGNDSKDFYGLKYLVDDGTVSDTVGGLSKTTYPSLAGTKTASGGTIDLTKISTLVSAVSGGSASRQRPTIFISDETVWNDGESLLTPIVQANYDANGLPMVTRRSKGVVPAAALKGAQGFTSMVIKGIPWVADEKCTSQYFYAVNENYIDWYGIKDPDLKSIALGAGSTVEGVYDEAPTDNTGFQWTGFLQPTDVYGTVAHIYMLGNLVTFQPRRQGVLTGVLGV